MTAESNAGGVVGWLARSRGGSGRVLLLIAALLAAAAGYYFYKAAPFGQQTIGTDIVGVSVALWLAASALAFVIAGVRQLSADPPEELRDAAARITLLSVVGVVGAATFLLGLTLLYQWGDIVTKLLREGDRTDAWKVFVALLAIIGGLAVMFLGLQAVRADERKAAGIRRAVYGFNAFLTGFLLLAVLIVANVIISLKFPTVIDTTKGGVYSISERSQKLLAELDQPVTAYLISPGTDQTYQDMQALLTVCQRYAPKLRVEHLEPTQSGIISSRLSELARKFPQLTEELVGLLLVYGEEKPENSVFVKYRDLNSSDSDPRTGESKRKFMGEVKLVSELSYLAGGKDKPTIYFTQGFGELDLNGRGEEGGLFLLQTRLKRRYYEVKPVTLEGVNPKIPDDAKLLVVAGPKQPYTPPAIEAIKAYLDRGGKAIFMLDTVKAARNDKTMPPTGFEELLAQYGLEVTNERLVTALPTAGQLRIGEVALGTVAEGAAQHPIASAFRRDRFEFYGYRLIRPPAEARPDGPYRTQTLIATDRRLPYWTETDPFANPVQTYQQMAKDPAEEERRLAKKPLPLMTVVAETTRGMPGAPPAPEKPKLAVFGDADFVSNVSTQDVDSVSFDLFLSTLEWLRDRPTNIGIEPRMAQTFELTPDATLKETQLKFLPLLVSIIGVLGLGLGVWLVRRQ